MNDAQLELFRSSLLHVMGANHTPFGLTPEALRVHLVGRGFDVATERVAQELQYLADKGLAATVLRQLNPKNQAWRITAAGRDAI